MVCRSPWRNPRRKPVCRSLSPVIQSANAYAKIYAVVRQIPRGKVATYGQVAALAGLAGKPRVVGYALFRVAEPEPEIPWQRVVNAKGEVSYAIVRNGSDYVQRALLEDEGIEFKPNGKIDLAVYLWRPDPESLTEPGLGG